MLDLFNQTVGYACGLAIILSLTVFPFLCIFRKTRGFAGLCLMISSGVVGFALWISSAIAVYLAWGGWAVVVGVMIFGVGVFPMALIIFAWNGAWPVFFMFVVVGAILLGMRVASVAALASTE